MPGPNGQGEAGADPSGQNEKTEQTQGRRVLRWMLIGLGGLVGAVLLLILGFLLVLQTNWGASRVGDALLGLANPFDEATIEIGQIEGNWLTGLKLYNVNIVREGHPDEAADSVRMAHVDTLLVRYRLHKLLSGTINLRSVYLSGADLRMRQQADSTWDLLNALGQDTTTVVDTTKRGFAFRIDQIQTRNVRAEARFYPPEKDSTLRLQNLDARISNLVIAEGTSLEVDRLTARYLPPGSGDAVDVNLSASYAENAIDVERLRLDSPNSNVRGQGRIVLPRGDADTLEENDFTLTASPLAFKDLAPFVSALPPEGSAVLDARIQGDGSQLDLVAEGSLDDGATFNLEGEIAPATAGPLRYVLAGQVRGFDTGYFSGAETQTSNVNADFSVDLAGLNPDSLGGTIEARLFDTALAGQQIREATLESRFEDGAATFRFDANLRGVTVRADGTGRFFDPLPTYRAEGRFDRLDLGALLQNPNQDSNISGQFTLNGEGLDTQTIDLDADLTLNSSSLNGQRINGGRANVTLSGGDLRFDANVNAPGGFLEAQGNAQLTSNPLTYEAEGRFDNLNLQLFTQNPSQSSNLNGRFSIDGIGTDPESANLTARFNLGPSVLNDQQIQRATADLIMERGDLRFDADIDSHGGSLTARGNATFENGTARYRIREGRFDNFNIAMFTGNQEQSSNLTGTFTANGQGTSPDAIRLDANLQLEPGRYGEYDLGRSSLDIDLRNGRLGFNGLAQIEGADFNLKGTARPFLNRPTFEAEGAFANLDVSRFTQDTTRTSALSGRINLTGTGFALDAMQLDATIRLDSSRFNQQRFDEGEIVLALDRGKVELTADVLTPDGRLNFQAGGNLFDDNPTFALREGTFRGLNLGTLLGNPNLQSSLNGTIMLDAQGTDPRTGVYEATITLAPSTLNGQEITDGLVTIEVRDGFLQMDASLGVVGGRAQIDASGRFFDEQPTYQATGFFENLNVASLAGNDSLKTGVSLTFNIEGVGLDPQTMRLQGHFDGSDAFINDITIDTLYTDFLLEDGLLKVEPFKLRSNVADANAQGTIAVFDSLGLYTSDFTLQATARDIEPVRPFIDARALSLGTGEIEAHVYGQPGNLRFDGRLAITSLVYNDIRMAGLDTRVAGAFGTATPGPVQPVSARSSTGAFFNHSTSADPVPTFQFGARTLNVAELNGEVQYFSLPLVTVERSQFDFSYQNEELRFITEFLVDNRRDARLSGRIDLRPDNRRMIVEDLGMRFDDDQWELLQEASISYGEEYRISNFLMYSDDQQLAIDGVVDFDGTQSLVLSIENFRIGAIADILEFDGLDGTLYGSLDLTGPATAPNLDGTLNFDILSFEQPVGDLRLGMRYDSLRLNMDALLTHDDGSTLTVDGYIPMDLRLSAPQPTDSTRQGVLQAATPANQNSGVDLQIVADQFAIGWIEPFLDPELIDEIEGRLTADIDVRGTFATPQVSGQADLANGKIHLPEYRVTYEDIRVDAELVDDQVLINHAEMHSGGGSAIATGTINLANLALGEFNIDISLEDFFAINSTQYRGDVSGDLVLSGTTREPVLGGNLNVLSADVYITDETTSTEFEPVTLEERDLQRLEQRFGVRVAEADTSTFVFYDALAMDLRVNLERDVWLRSSSSPEMNIQFTGDLTVEKDPYQDLALFGSIDVIPTRSYIDQFNRRFSIESGIITFNGPVLELFMDVQAEYAVRSRRSQGNEITILLSVEGRLDDLDLELSSDPATDQTNIISYLATGRPADEAFQLGGREALGAGTNLALGQLTSFVESAAGSELGLDVIEIQQDGLNGASVTAGKYVSRRLYVSVSQPISFRGTDTGQNTNGNTRVFTIEYELLDWLLLRLLSSGTNNVRLNLLYEFAY